MLLSEIKTWIIYINALWACIAASPKRSLLTKNLKLMKKPILIKNPTYIKRLIRNRVCLTYTNLAFRTIWEQSIWFQTGKGWKHILTKKSRQQPPMSWCGIYWTFRGNFCPHGCCNGHTTTRRESKISYFLFKVGSEIKFFSFFFFISFKMFIFAEIICTNNKKLMSPPWVPVSDHYNILL